MLEIPESRALSQQFNAHLAGRVIEEVVANSTPHGFAWFHGDPADYPNRLTGRRIDGAQGVAGFLQIQAQGMTLLLNDGATLRLYAPESKRPAKHQLFLGLDDGTALIGTVRMYGGFMAYPDGSYDNPYYLGARDKPSPLTEAFDSAYFETLVKQTKPTVSAKAFLATEQRIPGLGNGVLQDMLFAIGIHPARPMKTLSDADLEQMYRQVKASLQTMTSQGGRDTEPDLFGEPGGYTTVLSRKTWTKPCPKCGGVIERKQYLGGNVYFCPACQPLIKQK